MAKLRTLFSNWWTVSLLIVLLLVATLCFGLPLAVVGLRPWTWRVAFFVLIVGSWVVLAILRVRRSRRAQGELAAGITGGGDVESEEHVLAGRLREALAALKKARGGKRNYLYASPWYVMIGPPGSGKTTALVNSGLHFPFSDQALQGVGGTRNLDFMFADEAVLVDTAGRYTSQDSGGQADGQAWLGFLNLLKRNRPLQPVNGIIVAIGVDEILRSDRLTLDAHAGAIRRRIAEIRTRLEVTAPVYLLLTKSDLIAGFTEFFDDLDVNGRRAVLGHTFAHGTGAPTADQIATAFDEVAQAVSDRMSKRLAEEPDAYRRSLILGFPSQLSSLRPRLVRLVSGAFAAPEGAGGLLRGLYLTSGVQNGAPLDRLLAGVAEVFERPEGPTAGSGKAYFLNRLLGEVVFPEAGLVQMDPRARVRQQARLTGALGGIAVAATLILAFWGLSLFRNMALQETLRKQAGEVQSSFTQHGVDHVQVSSSDGDLEQVLPVLEELRGLAQGYEDQKRGAPPLTMRFGLFQSGLAQRADEAYRTGLRRILLPRLLLRAEDAMQQQIGNPLAVYEPLKVYLMLGGERPGGVDAATVRSWARSDWATASYLGADRSDIRKRLALHLDALLQDDSINIAWKGGRPPLDANLVSAARAAVQTMTLSERAYAILRQKGLAQGGAPWSPGVIVTSEDARAFANGDALREIQIPYLFTRQGFEKSYQLGLQTAQRDLENDLWVLGRDADTTSIREQISSVKPGVAAAYASEYIAQWEGVIKAMTPASYFADLAAYGAFTKSPSPWKLLLNEVRKNTIFAGGTTAAKAALTANVNQRLGRAAQFLPTGGGSLDAGTMISNNFREIHAYVGDGKATAPIDDFLAAVRSAGQAVIASRTSTGGGAGDALQAAMAQANAAVAAAGASAPALLQSFVAETAKGGSSAQVSAVQGAVTQAYASTVLPACRGVVQDRYPFFAGAADDARLVDMLDLFRSGGMLEGFVSQRLIPLMDTSGPVWRWKQDDPVSAAFDPASAEQLSEIPAIRDLLTVGLSYKVSLENLGAGVDAVEFGAGGAEQRFDKTTRGAKTMQWLPQAAAPEAHVTLYRAGQQVDQLSQTGPWALFRLIDKSPHRNDGELGLLVNFGSAPQTATLHIEVVGTSNPFNRGTIWTFRCPSTL